MKFLITIFCYEIDTICMQGDWRMWMRNYETERENMRFYSLFPFAPLKSQIVTKALITTSKYSHGLGSNTRSSSNSNSNKNTKRERKNIHTWFLRWNNTFLFLHEKYEVHSSSSSWGKHLSFTKCAHQAVHCH